jgi:hypothetical protein
MRVFFVILRVLVWLCMFGASSVSLFEFYEGRVSQIWGLSGGIGIIFLSAYLLRSVLDYEHLSQMDARRSRSRLKNMSLD